MTTLDSDNNEVFGDVRIIIIIMLNKNKFIVLIILIQLLTLQS